MSARGQSRMMVVNFVVIEASQKNLTRENYPYFKLQPSIYLKLAPTK